MSLVTLTKSNLAAPAKGNTALRALLMTGYVKVMRQGGGLGESSIEATHLSVTSSNGWPVLHNNFNEKFFQNFVQIVQPGKREQVWPSGPAPTSNKSNLGKATLGQSAFSLRS